MKKKVLSVLVCVIVLCGCMLALASCGDDAPEHTHEYTALKADEAQHWYERTCGDKKDVEPHTGGIVTETEKAECSVCATKYGDAKKVSEGLAFVSNGDGTCYVSGIGTCSDTVLVIPAKSPSGDSVIAIGQEAFRGNTAITSVTTGDSVVDIESYAFYKCTSLKTLIISDSLVSIQERAFHSCYALSDLFVGKNFKDFPLTAFYFCNGLKNIQVSEQNPYYTSIDGSFYDKSVSTIIRYAVGKSDTHFEIPNTVKTIGSQSFYAADQLLSVDIPDSVTSIESFAFESCISLISIKYHGTQEKWNSISKDYRWNHNTGNYTITYNDTSNTDDTVSKYIGEYVLHHIERKLIAGGDTTTYNLGDYYFGTTLSEQTIRAGIHNGTGNAYIGYNFGNEVYVTCNFVILDDNTAVAYLDNDVDLFENGNATDVFYFDIVQINGQPCFVLNATLGNHNYAYYVVKAN